MKMCATLPMCSTMTTPTTRRTTSTVSVVPVVLARLEQPSPCSPLTVCSHPSPPLIDPTQKANSWTTDAKQARDLVNVLQEAKQQIDPKLQEMIRYGGGGGGGRYGGGGYRGRGGGYGGGRRGQ
jgi:uncharacterized membrane protein YgcG